MGRFINADTFASTGQGILGNNMFAYCKNNSVSLSDSLGYRAELATSLQCDGSLQSASIHFTTSIGLSFSISFLGFFSYSGQICVSTDAYGSSEIQGSYSGGFSPDNVDPNSVPSDYKAVQFSLMGFVMLTNAPSVDKLTGPGYQMGGVVPISGLFSTGYDYNILEDTQNNTVYQGGTYSLGISTPGAHLVWGQTTTMAKVNFNIYSFFEGVQRRKFEMGYL